MGTFAENDCIGWLFSQPSISRARCSGFRSLQDWGDDWAQQQSFAAARKLVSQSPPQAGNRPVEITKGA
jgi:hypothetical protein